MQLAHYRFAPRENIVSLSCFRPRDVGDGIISCNSAVEPFLVVPVPDWVTRVAVLAAFQQW